MLGGMTRRFARVAVGQCGRKRGLVDDPKDCPDCPEEKDKSSVVCIDLVWLNHVNDDSFTVGYGDSIDVVCMHNDLFFRRDRYGHERLEERNYHASFPHVRVDQRSAAIDHDRVDLLPLFGVWGLLLVSKSTYLS